MVRWQSFRANFAPSWKYLIVAMVTVGALVLQGHLGGILTFGSIDQFSAYSTGLKHRNPAASQPIDPKGGQIQWRDHLDVS